MRKRRLSKALAMFLAAALTIPAAVPVAASESTADKEETVYVKTDANGEEKTVIVSDWLKNFSGEAKIKDATVLFASFICLIPFNILNVCQVCSIFEIGRAHV